MPDDPKLKELEKNRRLCLLHIRRGSVIFGLTAVGLLAVQQFIGIRLWMPFTILAVLSFTVLADIISYFYYCRQIRKMQG
jgi:hypothetical protein